MAINSQIVITSISVVGTIVAAVVAARVSRKNAAVTADVDKFKIEAVGKAEILKNKADSETKRIDQVLAGQQKFIETLHAENEYQRQELTKMRDDLEKLREKYEKVAEDRSTLVVKMAELRAEYEKLQQKYLLIVSKMVTVEVDKPQTVDLKDVKAIANREEPPD